MGVIDRWVMSTTLAWLNEHQRRLTNTRFVCMNLSGASLNDEKFMQDVFAMLAANIDIARHLCIEITESVALHDLNNTRQFIDKVRSFGAKVALDDFGAGYTSFSYLKELPADLLKIDGSFIVNMNNHPANVAIVEAIVNLAATWACRPSPNGPKTPPRCRRWPRSAWTMCRATWWRARSAPRPC
jgi:EAL domain-containing protein (putative c-di-GMP-specific phosphodiesterase class I)